jgi:hypothetical protein
MRDEVRNFNKKMGRKYRGLLMHLLGWCNGVEQAPNR